MPIRNIFRKHATAFKVILLGGEKQPKHENHAKYFEFMINHLINFLFRMV
jgi:hypothetical protein